MSQCRVPEPVPVSVLGRDSRVSGSPGRAARAARAGGAGSGRQPARVLHASCTRPARGQTAAAQGMDGPADRCGREGGSGAGHGRQRRRAYRRQRRSRGRGGHAPWAALGASPSAQPETLEGEGSTSSPRSLALTPDPNPNPNPNPNAPWAARRSSKSIAGMHLSTARLSGSSVRTAPHAPSRAHSHALTHRHPTTRTAGKAQGAGSHSETPAAWLPQSRAPGAPRGTAAAPRPERRKRWPARPEEAPWAGGPNCWLANLHRGDKKTDGLPGDTYLSK